MTKVGPTTWLRPSTIEGVLRLRRKLTEEPSISPEQAISKLKATYANAGVNFESALELHGRVPSETDTPDALFRDVIWTVLVTQAPTWASLLPRGREPLARALDPDARECFRRARVLDDVPSAEVIAWLDAAANMIRGSRDARLLEAGREAERLSFDWECAQVHSISSELKVKWVALDDNSAGYDLESYWVVDGRIVPKMVEVKAASSYDLEFFVSKNEWETWCRMGENYQLHVWDLQTKVLYPLTLNQITPHVPCDRGEGRWQNVRINGRALIVPSRS